MFTSPKNKTEAGNPSGWQAMSYGREKSEQIATAKKKKKQSRAQQYLRITLFWLLAIVRIELQKIPLLRTMRQDKVDIFFQLFVQHCCIAS